jgi:chromosome segregation protein
MQGFKSFADKTIISFENPITGVVGPNGCGKSNIADAVRWVLGEQSAKSMRGQKMDDIIFAGSADRKKVNMAEVTLIFDNTSHVLNSDKDEIEVTRRLFRDSGDAEYLINRNNVRLRDVVDLFLDTGLGKDSLSIISQGNVVSFADAKPIDRRGIFEEAAGVAKYKKRKIESLSKLERTKENLDRSTDILNELEKQVSPLKRAAHKAEIYREKKKRLEEIEITVLVQDIDQINAEIESAKKTLFDIETKTAMYSTNIQVSETKVQEQRRQIAQLDKEINALQDELMQNYNDVQALEARKTELDERRKYIVETGSNEQKAKELKDLLDAAKIEYDDRRQRLDDLNTDIKLFSEKLNLAAQSIVEKSSVYEAAQNRERSLENRKNVLESLMKNPFNNQQGIRSIMDSQNALHGILGVVGQILSVEKGI